MRSLVLLMSVFVLSCSSSQKVSDKEAEKISFSIAKAKSAVGDLVIIGSSPACSIRWEVSKTILTHRMNCSGVEESELWAYLLGMTSKLRAEYKNKPLNFVRFTTKDFPKEERAVGKLMSSSKLWARLNKKNIRNKKHQAYSNKFLAKVIEKKSVFSIVPRALRSAGYKFLISETKIEKYKVSPVGKLLPKNAKVVFRSQRAQRAFKKGL